MMKRTIVILITTELMARFVAVSATLARERVVGRARLTDLAHVEQNDHCRLL
jgi:hypothetical protein